MAKLDHIQIENTQGYELQTSVFGPNENNNKVVVIASATGVKQRYYFDFAQYLASHKYTVYTFDYNGIGKNPKTLKKTNTDLHHWSNSDLSSVICHAKKKHTKATITLVAHSIGGQLCVINNKLSDIDNLLFVCSQSGYWRLYPRKHKAMMWLYWNFLIPTTTFLYGYFPAKRLGLFENLPKGVALEWRRWGNSKQYMLAHHSDQYLKKFKGNFLGWSATKDFYAPYSGSIWLYTLFKKQASNYQHIHLDQSYPKLQHLGHFGFFRIAYKEKIWNPVIHWLENPKKNISSLLK
ncbi:MAG: alpha/beta fold hydrolase [Flavobacteriaceae bacterium]|nr:alpha/beta fold hydrolase [Flavobacteriaceae bacterium]